MAADDADGDGDAGEKSAFRWLAAARYAAAAVMLVLVVVVIAKAIMVIHRPSTLAVSLVGGSVFARRVDQQDGRDTLELTFSLRGSNPSGSSVVYYTGVDLSFFDVRSPEEQELAAAYLERGTMRPAYFDALYAGTLITDVTVQINGSLVATGAASGRNTTARRTTLYCWPVVIGVDPGNVRQFLDLNLNDVFCREVQGKHFI
ncbi:hypothetical protein ACP4OV_017306 [Aristida adscensionis]